MSFLLNPHLDLTIQKIETARCAIIPFSTDSRVDIRELWEEFCKANRNLWSSPFIPTYEQEMEFVEQTEKSIRDGELFENFILEKGTNRFIGCGGFSMPEEHCMNIGVWIREDEHGKGYATEVYSALLDWAREYTIYDFIKHSLVPENIASRKLALKFGGISQEEKTKSGHPIYHIPL